MKLSYLDSVATLILGHSSLISLFMAARGIVKSSSPAGPCKGESSMLQNLWNWKTEKNDNLYSKPIQSVLIVKEWHLFMALKTVLILKGLCRKLL